jgi:hypothetical protein
VGCGLRGSFGQFYFHNKTPTNEELAKYKRLRKSVWVVEK